MLLGPFRLSLSNPKYTLFRVSCRDVFFGEISEVFCETCCFILLLRFGRAKLSGPDMAKSASQQCPQVVGPHRCHGRAAADVGIWRLQPQSQTIVFCADSL